jgi:hypothetical protein
VANYFQKLSIAITLPKEAARYAVALATAADAVANGERVNDPALLEVARNINPDQFTTGCDWRVEEGEDEVAVHSEDHAQLELVASILQETLIHFDLEGVITIEWSNDASKPLLDAFGGGAVVITKDEQRWMTTSSWVDEQIRQIDMKSLNDRS